MIKRVLIRHSFFFSFFSLFLFPWTAEEGGGAAFAAPGAFAGRENRSPANYTFRHYNINNGLSQNTVYAIHQDSQGFLWFGTKDGLNRFDGTTFRTYKFTPGGILRDNVFHRILRDRHDNLWTGTEDGVYIYNPRREEFTRFERTTPEGLSPEGVVSDLLLDADGDIWISVDEKGLFRYDPAADTLTHYTIPQSPDGMKMISLCPAPGGRVWVFPYNRPFVRVDKVTGDVSEFHLRDDPHLVYGTGEIWKVIPDGRDRILIASSTRGVISVNTADLTHRILLDADANGKPVFARCLTRIDPRTLWIGSESGLYILDTETGETVNLRHNSHIPHSLSDNAVYSISKDREGGIWIGTYFGGVNYYSDPDNQFELFYPLARGNRMNGSRVREFCSAPGGRIWIGTEDSGLNLFDPVTGNFLRLPHALRTLHTNIHALCADGDCLWIGTFSKGLNRYNLKTGRLTTYTHTGAPGAVSHNSTFAIHKDRRGTLWVGNLLGLNIYNYDRDDFSQIDHLQGTYIRDIYEDTDGKIWIATFARGLHRYDPDTEVWRVFLDDPAGTPNAMYNKLNSLFEDSRRRLWITTEGGGLYLFDRESETFRTVNSAHGLPNDVVYQIEEDGDANLWLSTNSGLVCYDPETNAFRNYTVRNGLKTNQFNYQSSYRTPDGTLYFGSIDGFLRFTPHTFRDPEPDISPVLTDLFIGNERVSPADTGSPLKESILYTRELTLPRNKNSIRLEYATLHYTGHHLHHIRYRLDGFDKDWLHAKNRQDIIYSNLKPGRYTLTLQADGAGDRPTGRAGVRTLRIRIRPPFWLSVWAYSLYILLFALSLLLLYRYLNTREQRIRRRKMKLFEQEKERELYRSKIDFFTNVAHEIRTPLSLIKAPLDHVLTIGQTSDEVTEDLRIMSKNTDRLLHLTNQLLDFRKTESDAYSLHLNLQNASALIRDTFLRFTPLARRRNLLFDLDLPATDIHAQLDREAFIKIISNLMNNAIKYCDTRVRIKAYAAAAAGPEGRQFHLLTENDGERIPPEYREDIFKPFVHLDRGENGKTVGTGIGLALSRSLAGLHRGDLVLEESDDLIRFHLTLPLPAATGAPLPVAAESGDSPSEAEEEKQSAGYTILLVEDDVELLRFQQKVLSVHYRVHTASDGAEALDCLRRENTNLIVSDVMMPGMDGLELTRRVKCDLEFSHIPVILLTAKVNAASTVEGFETGADAYIGKPFSLEILMAQIASLLQSREKLCETFLRNPFLGVHSIVHTPSDREFIRKLNAAVHENLHNPDFIVDEMAGHLNMSRSNFYRKIKGILNLSPKEYLRVERLKEAALLLREKGYKVNEVSYRVGFTTPSYFSKCFQQQFGVRPSEIEQEYEQKNAK
ncbi:MAG: response regulator [Proteiniphilum sp.]|jgi:ligand-binding sensor domain-containing protein/signal transduction histidine kinase/DNA-binding response OmpR family regulator|nr:response regulator [Proteiniphilum sp.]